MFCNQFLRPLRISCGAKRLQSFRTNARMQQNSGVSASSWATSSLSSGGCKCRRPPPLTRPRTQNTKHWALVVLRSKPPPFMDRLRGPLEKRSWQRQASAFTARAIR
eukprot:CAMPEP_0174333950 /NCGR_PEP_ID=MMETSP0810-20121108/19546_1 /TAXON_ID=73025 ORGANISM="Eutreptiella gymnastica-like, Strain CCMP1594" /NCGR_SAMPLE_ID=MMETSP0810 /ASSEMBLY_ACC=CAM_ASM_000659 /LENGTH=106 /DNA_ID=CAMNT_0015451343 /DNA_START=222 /DNA_END=542 /DNA_ORIENTATION=+